MIMKEKLVAEFLPLGEKFNQLFDTTGTGSVGKPYLV